MADHHAHMNPADTNDVVLLTNTISFDAHYLQVRVGAVHALWVPIYFTTST